MLSATIAPRLFRSTGKARRLPLALEPSARVRPEEHDDGQELHHGGGKDENERKAGIEAYRRRKTEQADHAEDDENPLGDPARATGNEIPEQEQYAECDHRTDRCHKGPAYRSIQARIGVDASRIVAESQRHVDDPDRYPAEIKAIEPDNRLGALH